MHAVSITATAAEAHQAPLTGPLAGVIDFVLERFADELTLDDLAGSVGMSRFHFCRSFQRAVGAPPVKWLWTLRTLLAAEFIDLDPKWSLTDVAFACGFTSSAHFSRTFKSMHGISPSGYRKRAQAMQATRAGVASTKSGLNGYDRLYGDGTMARRVAIKACVSARSAP